MVCEPESFIQLLITSAPKLGQSSILFWYQMQGLKRLLTKIYMYVCQKTQVRKISSNWVSVQEHFSEFCNWPNSCWIHTMSGDVLRTVKSLCSCNPTHGASSISSYWWTHYPADCMWTNHLIYVLRDTTSCSPIVLPWPNNSWLTL